MEEVQTRHNRFGIVAECALSSFGDLPSCTNGPSANNGLWTSLLVGAETFRYLVTGDENALDLATTYFAGMKNLNGVTGIKGLMARSFVTPTEPRQSATDGWYNSTAPGYEGWQWLGDTSSDEVVGHMFAYSILAHVLNDSVPAKSEAIQLVVDIMTYIVENNLSLIDVTGRHTTWGVWAPEFMNGMRNFSDGRFVSRFGSL